MGVLKMNAQQLNEKADELAEIGILKLGGRFLMALSAPAAIWAGVTMWSMNAELAKLSERVQIALQNPYNGADAAHDNALWMQRMLDLSQRVQDNKITIKENRDRVRALENFKNGGAH